MILFWKIIFEDKRTHAKYMTPFTPVVAEDVYFLNGGTCFEENISRKTKQNLTVMQNFECMCIIFIVVHNFNGGSQSGCCLHNQDYH